MKKDKKPYRIVGAYDSETTNLTIDGEHVAFPILHQLGLLDCPVEDVTADNVEDHVTVEVYRHAFELFARLDEIVATPHDYVPVIMCHNLSFDFYGLSPWLARHDVRVLAKSARKPITLTIRDDNGFPLLVIWDTLIFSQQRLERMGIDCGYEKGVGEWDYDLVRTPETPLSVAELDYAKKDVYALIAWIGWWLARNPEIMPDMLGLNVVTKTGVVRARRKARFEFLKGIGQKRSVGNYWLWRNRSETPKTDDELFTMQACTRGGFTFCASECASVPFDLEGTDEIIAAFDATSQHPAQIVSHVYPVNMKEANARNLALAFDLVGKMSVDKVLSKWFKPFPVAFDACFEFINLRPRKDSIFERFGIYPLASARYKAVDKLAFYEPSIYDDGDKTAARDNRAERGYIDEGEGIESAFGKIISAQRVRLYITELTAWEIWQAYEWDDVTPVHGYMTGKFSKPCDLDIISTMQFYKAKNAFKAARSEFYERGTISNSDELKKLGIAPAIAGAMEDGTLSSGDVEASYLSLKADLNAIFGVNCADEFRRDTILTASGIDYTGEFGVCNAPKNPKVWYQFGQRIVGWSRIAQICAMSLCEPYALHIVNGDTDSIKVHLKEKDLPIVSHELEKLGAAIDAGKHRVCSRVRAVYPDLFDPLLEIGYYVSEFNAKRFCASWNKAYCEQETGKDGKPHFSFTLAGIPTKRRESSFCSFIGVDGFADRLYALGWSFESICNVMLGYNSTYSNSLLRLNSRAFPEWGSQFYGRVTDYRGETCTVAEPNALALYPMGKTVNDTASADNMRNMAYALRNNEQVSVTRKMLTARGVIDYEEVFA